MASTDRPEAGAFGAKESLLHGALAVGALLSVATSLIEIALRGAETLPGFLLFALLLGLVSGRQSKRLRGAGIYLLTTETLILLGLLMTGPFHAVVLAVLASLVTGFRLRKRPDFYLLSVPCAAISTFLTGQVY